MVRLKQGCNITYKPYYCLVYAIPIFASAFVLVYHYAALHTVYPWSDYTPHIAVAENFLHGDYSPVGKPYPHILFYPLFHIIIALLSYITADIAWAAIIVIMLSLVFTVLGIRKLALRQFQTPTNLQRYAIDFVAVTSIAIGHIAGFLTDGKYYLFYGSFNTWHNPTLTFMRPFAIYATYYFLELYAKLRWDRGTDETERRKIYRLALIFSALLFLSVLAKPNFALMFLVAAGLLCFFRLIRNVSDHPREALSAVAMLLICVLPSILLMLMQMVLCTKYSVLSFGLQLNPLSAIFSVKSLRAFLALGLAPTLFLICGYKYVRDEPLLQLGYIMLAVSSFIWFCTVQGLQTMTDYSWSYYYTMFFGIVTAAVFSIKYIKDRRYLICFAVIWSLHLFYGLKYIYYIVTSSNGRYF